MLHRDEVEQAQFIGMQRGLAEGLQQGFAQGFQQGLAQGRQSEIDRMRAERQRETDQLRQMQAEIQQLRARIAASEGRTY